MKSGVDVEANHSSSVEAPLAYLEADAVVVAVPNLEAEAVIFPAGEAFFGAGDRLDM